MLLARRTGSKDASREKKIEHLETLLKKADFSKLTDEQIVRDIRSGRDRKLGRK